MARRTAPSIQSNAVFTISHQHSAPTAVTPAAGATVSTDVPTLGATVTAGASQVIQWQLATDAAFTQNLKTITESDSDARISGATTEVVPNASQLFQGVWYIRARAVSPTGGTSAASNYTTATTFTVAHAPVAANMAPTGDTKMPYGTNGTVLFDWDFSDPSPVDTQTAYRVEVSVVSSGVIVSDTTKVASTATAVSINIPAAYKDVQLRWRVQVWDSDDVTNGYSGYNIFRVADVPTVNITQPIASGVMSNPQPMVQWGMTATGGRTQYSYRVRFYDTYGGGNVLVHDSLKVVSAATSYAPSSSVLVLGHTYTIQVDLVDSWGLTGIDTNTAILAQWTAPASPGLRGDSMSFETDGFVLITWTNVNKDVDWYAWRVYRRLTGTAAWTLLSEVRTDSAYYEFHDWVVGANYTYDYSVVQVALRFGNLVESTYQTSTVTPVSSDYWLIDEYNEANNVRLYSVIDDSYTDEFETEEILSSAVDVT